MKRIFYITAIILVLIIGVVFSARNAAVVSLDFMVVVVEINLSLALIIALIIGAGLGIIVSFFFLVKSKRNIASLNKQTALLNKELDNLRSLPIRDKH